MSRLNPRVLVVGRYAPDNFIRWLADGFTLSGCQVVRCGPFEAPVGWPENEFPAVLEYPGAARTVGDVTPRPVRIDVESLVTYFSAERGFTPRLVVIDMAGGWAEMAGAGSHSYETVVLDQPDDAPHCRVFGASATMLKSGVDLNTFRPVQAAPSDDLSALLPYGYEPTPALLEWAADMNLSRALVAAPQTICDQIAALRRAAWAVVPDRDKDLEWALRARACGTPLRIPPSSASPPIELYDLIRNETWIVRASTILKAVGIEPGGVMPGMPRLRG